MPTKIKEVIVDANSLYSKQGLYNVSQTFFNLRLRRFVDVLSQDVLGCRRGQGSSIYFAAR